MELLAKIAEFFKLKPQYIAAVCLTCAALLFLPKPWLVKIGVDAFAKEQKGWVGVFFLLSLAFFLCTVVASLSEKKQQKKKRLKREQSYSDLVNHMSPDERGFLKLFIDRQQKSLALPSRHEVVQALQAQGIIHFTGFSHDYEDVYTLDLGVWKHLQAHSELLENATLFKYGR